MASRLGDDRLEFLYMLEGDLERIVVPPPVTPARADDLWEHTCFEAFVGTGGPGYLEFNLSPSGQWAAYRFEGYRDGGANLRDVEAPSIELMIDSGRLVLRARVQIPPADALTVGLTAVIEERGQRWSYWASNHPAGAPDFHQASGRTLTL